MSKKFSESFKYNVVEKAINRTKEVIVDDIAKEYGIANSTVGRWIRESKRSALGNATAMTTKEKRPQDWKMAEKLQAIIDCATLDDEAISAYCR